MKIAIIAAVAKDGAIGNDGEIPWHFPEDMARFKKLTLGKLVIMGRKTYESIGHPLKNRLNIIVSRRLGYDLSNQGGMVVGSFEAALAYAKRMFEAQPASSKVDEVFCIGGAEIYRLAMPIADRIYLTRIEKRYQADTFFPAIDTDIWRCVYAGGGGPYWDKGEKFFAQFLEFDRSKITHLE